MPPTQDQNSTDDKAKDIIALCHLIMASDSFNPDLNQVASHLGIAHGKNIPRRINTIVNPHGFEFKAGKMSLIGVDVLGQLNGRIRRPVSPTLAPQKPRSSKKKVSTKSPITPKKRKVETDSEEADMDVEENKD